MELMYYLIREKIALFQKSFLNEELKFEQILETRKVANRLSIHTCLILHLKYTVYCFKP